jgi:hypothetical protein
VLDTIPGLTGTSYAIPIASFGAEAIALVRVGASRTDDDGTFDSLQAHGIYVQVDEVATVGLATEADTALALGIGVASGLGRADEIDTALSLGLSTSLPLGRADEADTPIALLPGASDPYFSSVVFLSGFEGADGSTSAFTEESPVARTVTPFNGAEIDTAQSKFGSSSILLPTSGTPWLQCTDSNDWAFGSGDFTIEGFIRFSTPSTFNGIAGQYTAGQISWWFQYVNTGTKHLEFGWSTNGSSVSTQAGNWTHSTGVWYHGCVDRSSGTQRIYLDGSMLSKVTNSDTLFNSTTNMLVGAVNNQQLRGWLDEFRITKGVARYASDSGFTVPTLAYPRS